MSIARFIKQVVGAAGTDRDLSEADAFDMFAAMLDGGVADMELGAGLCALVMKTQAAPELLGFYRAMSERMNLLRTPDTALRPLIFAAYGGARQEPNLLPLLVLLLQRLRVPVLLHGTLEGAGRIASAYILRELGVLPARSLTEAQKSLNDNFLAFLPTALLCPGLAALLSLRSRLGISNPAHILVTLLDPFEVGGLRWIGTDEPQQLERLEMFLLATGFDALLMKSTDGEPFANPRQRPRIKLFHRGKATVLFEEELLLTGGPRWQLCAIDAHATAAWVKQAMAGEAPIPHPLVNQLACCLYACGYADDMNQAKAIAAIETGSAHYKLKDRLTDGSRFRAP